MFGKISSVGDICMDNITLSDIITKRRKELMTINGESIQKNLYSVGVLYNSCPLYIQFDRCKILEINMDTNNVKLEIPKTVYDFIIMLEKYIVSYVFKNSERLFSGKEFTLKKISSSLISNRGDNYTLITTLGRRNVVYNQYKQKIDKGDIIRRISRGEGIDSNVIVKLVNLQFIDNRFTYNFVLEQSKVYVDDYLDKYSIMDSSSIDKEISSSEDDIKYDGAMYDEYYESDFFNE